MYICERCGYSTTIKCNLKSHLSRKKICPNTYSNKDIMYLKGALIHKYAKNESKMNPNESKMNPNESNKTYACKFCKQCYSTNSNLHKHMKKCSKVDLTDNSKVINYISEIEQENKEIKKSSTKINR
jgi:hypothetical protein